MNDQTLVRFCPNCQTERALTEMFCEGTIGAHRCDWNLLDVSIRPTGWRPAPVIPAQAPQPPATLTCANGHGMEAGDLICSVCGADLAQTEVAATPSTQPAPGQAEETVIGGWRVLRAISSAVGLRDRYLVEETDSDRSGVLTLYHHGAEPDPSVYDALRRVSLEHVPEIFATGRWNDRAFEVAEELTGGTLADLGIVVDDATSVRRIVYELGKALDALAESGLRHRDIRPGTLLVRNRDPLDLVIGGFGSARLSEFDLDIVSPLEVTRYMAPEAVAGGVAAASDWWSLGIVLLEQITRGACFEGVNQHAFLIHILSHGVTLPAGLPADIEVLLRGLLARDRHQRWKWSEVQDWLDGHAPYAPPLATLRGDQCRGPRLTLGGNPYFSPQTYALAAAEAANWAEAQDHFTRGSITTWAQDAAFAPQVLAGLRRIAKIDTIDEDCRLLVALKVLNPEMPPIYRGDIVTPKWLLDHPIEGYDLVSGAVPDLLSELDAENWLLRLKSRAIAVRTRAHNLSIDLDEDTLRINLLSTSRARLAAEWEERIKYLPDSEHHGLLNLLERRSVSEEDLIVVLSAAISQFRSCDAIVNEAGGLARQAGVLIFDETSAQDIIQWPRGEILQAVAERIEGFAKCAFAPLNEWADQFRLEKRLPLSKALVLLSIPQEEWQEPQKQQYISQILDFFEKKVVSAVLRGPLVRMTIARSSPRVDLSELQTSRLDASALLNHLIQRSERSVTLDPAALDRPESSTGSRLQSLERHNQLYKRDTGIDGLYLGFPFILTKDGRTGSSTRIAPVLLWPVRLHHEVGTRGNATLSFDNDREEVRLNPALDAILGPEAAKAWQQAAAEVLGRSALTAADVIDAFGTLAAPRSRALGQLPGPKTQVAPRSNELDCSAVLFHVTFMGQAIGEDIRTLKERSPAGTGLETALRLNAKPHGDEKGAQASREVDRFFTVHSDPSQEEAVLLSREAPGLLVEGPPGTGKSQTIVNMVCDAIGRRQSLLIVCQKHAALEVVCKRLIAEGLGQRIVMVNDVNRDRMPIIRMVREQLEEFARRSIDPVAAVRRKREATAARIDALEGAIDRHHEALHRVDDRIGTSYRTVLGELIRLEEPAPPLDIPALRPLLDRVSVGELASLEEEIAPLVRHWLPAKYEGSGLAPLLPFAPDQATLEDFTEAFKHFAQCEALRVDVLMTRSSSFEVDDPSPHRAWLAAHGHEFLDLPDEQRLTLARWLPLFRHADRPGDRLISELSALRDDLTSCRSADHDGQLSPALTKVEAARLTKLKDLATEASAPSGMLGKFNPFKALRKRQVVRFLKDLGDTGTPQRLEALISAATLELKWRPIRARIVEVHAQLKLPELEADAGLTLLPTLARTLGDVTGTSVLASHLAIAPWPERMDEAVAKESKDAVLKLFAEFDAAFARFEARAESQKALHRLESWVQPEWVQRCSRAIVTNEINATSVNSINAALPSLSAYQQFRGRAQRLSPLATSAFAAMRAREAQLEVVPVYELEELTRRILNREARLGWKNSFEQSTPELAFERHELESKIASLETLDLEMRALNRELLKEDFEQGSIAPLRAWEDITRLTGQRARRLREFIDMGSSLGLMKLRPIWLMNPDVASRVLPLKAALFDKVIYDEASQMPVEFALPSLFRARVTIVSGDEKQMPPTAFFSSRIENDEAQAFDGEMPDEDATEDERESFDETWNRREIKDCPDLLQLARTCLPNARLQIHYRSAYRELINYSNAAFYGNDLSVPVRHPESTVLREKPIEMVRVDGVYQDQTNPEEANKVVELLAEMWKAPYAQRPSVGVVTFNRKQADLIEEALELRAEQDPEFREAYRLESERNEDGEDMGVFVKNVENVQGDERDVIFFSSTFGRNKQGTFRRNFGVLGQKGGERRLNVAVTRSRQKIVMVTSMPISDISDILTTRRPPTTPRDFLQGYMEYARAVSGGEFSSARTLLSRLSISRETTASQKPQRSADGFIDAVGEFLRSLNLSIKASEEGDAFGLDYAVERPDTGLFAIGIECDAPRHALLARARAREVWRSKVLGRAIPVVHRVSSHGWYHNGADERQRLADAVQAALRLEVAA
ncbi:AAA domain-containing protein [Ottowia thiooxydans]|uniref:Primosomal replication protein N n=1 Tax=Ottowia thiooxydans TaxID=219182 RepID=A0ABV2QHC5_9BURK